MVDIMAGFMEDAKFLVILAIGVMALVFVVATWVRTKSMVPTLGAILLGAVVIWGVNNFDTLQNQVDEDVQHNDTQGRIRVTR